MVKVTGLHTLGNDAIEDEYMSIYNTWELVLYIIKTIIGVKSYRKLRCSREQQKWLDWAENFINYETGRISRLVIILGTDSLEEIYGYQITLSMLRALSFHQLFHTRLKKPIRADWQRPKNGHIKYGIRVPRNSREAAQSDKENGNTLRENAILKELEALM